MPRCSGSSQCNCVLLDGDRTVATGSGTSADPYRVDALRQGVIQVVDTPTIDLHMTGTGIGATPYVLQADAHLLLGELDNVSGTSPTVGQVLAWDGTQWGPVPPVTATPGLVNTSGCLSGDGSSTTPLLLNLASGGGLVCAAGGLKLEAPYNSNMRINHRFSLADDDETLAHDHDSSFKTMPNGTHVYTAPDWATTAFIDFEVQMLYASNGAWAGSVGRCVYRRTSAPDSINPAWGDISTSMQGLAMMSQRVSGPRGSSVGYREQRLLSDVVAGETITLFSQLRATSLAGGGDTQADASLTVMLSSIIWSDNS